jgi:Leucine-rich repeat (LRR) protein
LLTFLNCGYKSDVENAKTRQCKIKEIINLPENLKELYCNNNDLYELPKLPSKLEKLNCSNNHIKVIVDLPDTLDSLECSHNEISKIEKLPPSLWSLSCRYNKLTKIDNLPLNLNILECQFNNIEHIELTKEIRYLDCSKNKIKEIDFTNCNHLEDLNCDENPIVDFDNIPNSVKRIECDIDFWTLKNIPSCLTCFNDVDIFQLLNERKIISKIPKEEICSISLQNLEDKCYEECLNCHKPFILDYIQKWLKINKICPCCTKDWIYNKFIYQYVKV